MQFSRVTDNEAVLHRFFRARWDRSVIICFVFIHKMWYDMILIILINEYSIYLKKKKKNWIVLVPILYYLIISLRSRYWKLRDHIRIGIWNLEQSLPTTVVNMYIWSLTFQNPLASLWAKTHKTSPELPLLIFAETPTTLNLPWHCLLSTSLKFQTLL
jgi:hypothetical protein